MSVQQEGQTRSRNKEEKILPGFENETTFSNCQQTLTSPGGQILLFGLSGLMLVKVAVQKQQQDSSTAPVSVTQVTRRRIWQVSELTWSPLSHNGSY